jgi:hypothetical protein
VLSMAWRGVSWQVGDVRRALVFMRHLNGWPGNRCELQAMEQVGAIMGAVVVGSGFGDRELLCCPAGQCDAMWVGPSNGLCSISGGGKPNVM